MICGEVWLALGETCQLRACRMIFSYQYLAIPMIVTEFFEGLLGWAGQYQ
jgi:hypothetical protein